MTDFTIERREKFLKTLADTCNITRACEAAGVTRPTAYNAREADPEFAAAWDRAKKIGADVLEDEAVRRAHEGWDEPVFFQGVQTSTVRKFSDTLLTLLLKGAKPDTYRENSKVELHGTLDINKASDEELLEELTLLTGGAGVLKKPADDDASDLVE